MAQAFLELLAQHDRVERGEDWVLKVAVAAVPSCVLPKVPMPAGHTSYSWGMEPTGPTLPPGHTAYSWGGGCRQQDQQDEPDEQEQEQQEMAAAEEQEVSGCPAELIMTVLVPDGPWECARALVRELERRSATGFGRKLQRMVLDDQVVAGYESKLIEALKAGAGRGRVSTIEACALCLSEVAAGVPRWGVPTNAVELLGQAMEPLLEYVQALPHSDSGNGSSVHTRLSKAAASGGGGGPKPADTKQLAAWTVALQEAARAAATETHPLGLRRCIVCNMALKTPLIMPNHLQGRKHCEATARHYLQQCEADSPGPQPGLASAARVFHEHSTVRLMGSTVEPPDVAIAAQYVALCS